MVKVLRTVGDKGQVTIPKEVREVLNVREGDIIEFDVIRVARKATVTSRKTKQSIPSEATA